MVRRRRLFVVIRGTGKARKIEPGAAVTTSSQGQIGRNKIEHHAGGSGSAKRRQAKRHHFGSTTLNLISALKRAADTAFRKVSIESIAAHLWGLPPLRNGETSSPEESQPGPRLYTKETHKAEPLPSHSKQTVGEVNRS